MASLLTFENIREEIGDDSDALRLKNLSRNKMDHERNSSCSDH